MKVEIEMRSDMSRGDTFRALPIITEAASRLAHRFTDAELERLAQAGAEIVEVASAEHARRRPHNEGIEDTSRIAHARG